MNSRARAASRLLPSACGGNTRIPDLRTHVTAGQGSEEWQRAPPRAAYFIAMRFHQDELYVLMYSFCGFQGLCNLEIRKKLEEIRAKTRE